jgi:hypothetical protein
MSKGGSSDAAAPRTRDRDRSQGDPLVGFERQHESAKHERTAREPSQMHNLSVEMEQPELVTACEALSKLGLPERADLWFTRADDLCIEGE